MNEVIQSGLSNIAIIFLMHLCIDIFLNRKEDRSEQSLLIGMVSLVTIAVIIMFYLPIKFGGFQFDLRVIPLVFLAYKWGPKYVLLALFISSTWRLGMGGEGAVPGIIFGMVIPTLLALFIRKITKTILGPFTLFCLITLAWLISDLPIIFILPEGWSVFREIALMRLLSFQLTAFTLYFFIANTENEMKLKDQLKYFAERDPLTELYNIRTFEKKIKSCSKAVKKRFIIMIDIDHFKLVNDRYGHLNGDLTIKNVAGVISNKTSQYDEPDIIIGRYGGEEFILYMEVYSSEEILTVLEDIRKEIENTTFYTEDGKVIGNLTVSIGVSEIKNRGDLHKSIERADKWLYQSKRNGRNQITGA